MSAISPAQIEEIGRRGSIKDSDVAKLQKAISDACELTESDAEALITLNKTCRVQDLAWSHLFIETIAEYLVNDAEPQGYLNAQNVGWLTAKLCPEGRVETKAELELMIQLLCRSCWSPESLSVLTLDQVRFAVETGTGPLRGAQPQGEKKITESDCETLRRILYAFGGDIGSAITVAEAKVLASIDDLVAASPPSFSFADLYVKVLANVALVGSGLKAPIREVALGRELWFETTGETEPDKMVEAMAKAGPSPILNAYREQSSEDRALAWIERQRTEIITGEPVSQDGVEWLCEQFGREGDRRFAERLLLAFLGRGHRALHPALQAALGQVSKAA